MYKHKGNRGSKRSVRKGKHNKRTLKRNRRTLKRKYGGKSGGTKRKQGEEELKDECVVCLEETECKTNCNHSLCRHCLDQLTVPKNCPICRRKITSLNCPGETINVEDPMDVLNRIVLQIKDILGNDWSLMRQRAGRNSRTFMYRLNEGQGVRVQHDSSDFWGYPQEETLFEPPLTQDSPQIQEISALILRHNQGMNALQIDYRVYYMDGVLEGWIIDVFLV